MIYIFIRLGSAEFCASIVPSSSVWQVSNIKRNLFAQIASHIPLETRHIVFRIDEHPAQRDLVLRYIWLDFPLQGISAMEVYDFLTRREECLGIKRCFSLIAWLQSDG